CVTLFFGGGVCADAITKHIVSTFNPENDPESGGIFAIRMWSGSRSKGLCNQDKRVLIVAVPEHFELDREPGQAHLLSRMGAYLDETCGKDAEGFQLFASKLDIMNTEPDRIKDGLYAQYLEHRWANVINSAED